MRDFKIPFFVTAACIDAFSNITLHGTKDDVFASEVVNGLFGVVLIGVTLIP